MKSVETIEFRAITGLRFNKVKYQSSSYSVSINVSQCEPERETKMRLATIMRTEHYEQLKNI